MFTFCKNFVNKVLLQRVDCWIQAWKCISGAKKYKYCFVFCYLPMFVWKHLQFSQRQIILMENKSIAYTFGSQHKYPKTDNNYLGILSVQICNITDKDYNQRKKWSETFTFIPIRFERTKGHIWLCWFSKCNRAFYFRIFHKNFLLFLWYIKCGQLLNSWCICKPNSK